MSRTLKQFVLSICTLFLLISIAGPAIAQTVDATPASPGAEAQAAMTAASNAVSAAKIKSADDDGDNDHSRIPVEIVVPLASFIFVAAVVLVPRYMKEKSARHRLDTLRLMMEKGQSVPEDIIKQILVTEEPKRSSDPKSKHLRQLRDGLTLTGVGIALVVYRFASPDGNHKDALIFGLLGIGIGVAFLIAYKISDKHINS